jgi:large subunit ribosomal protein L18
VFKSLKNISAQLIDDVSGATLAAASTMEKDVKARIKNGGNTEAAGLVGEAIARKSMEKGIVEVAFDRGGFLYHGRVKALADKAREAGLKF